MIEMDGGSVIAMDGGSSDGQRQCNGWWDDGVIVMGNGIAVTQWTAQWVADNCCQCRSGAMGGITRWLVVAITVDSSSKIAMDGGSDNGQQRHDGR
jgi:hypothetical protein